MDRSDSEDTRCRSLLYRGILCERRGDMYAALDTYREALTFAPVGKDLHQELLQILGSLQSRVTQSGSRGPHYDGGKCADPKQEEHEVRRCWDIARDAVGRSEWRAAQTALEELSRARPFFVHQGQPAWKLLEECRVQAISPVSAPGPRGGFKWKYVAVGLVAILLLSNGGTVLQILRNPSSLTNPATLMGILRRSANKKPEKDNSQGGSSSSPSPPQSDGGLAQGSANQQPPRTEPSNSSAPAGQSASSGQAQPISTGAPFGVQPGPDGTASTSNKDGPKLVTIGAVNLFLDLPDTVTAGNDLKLSTQASAAGAKFELVWSADQGMIVQQGSTAWWRPPANTPPGDQVRLSFLVRDPKGEDTGPIEHFITIKPAPEPITTPTPTPQTGQTTPAQGNNPGSQDLAPVGAGGVPVGR